MVRSMHIKIFLSCSFDPKDEDVVAFFASICHGLDIQCVNVDKGYVLTPPEKARELISDSQALLAIATCRDEMATGNFMMPKAVSEEIAMAFANKKPILIFAENGVDMKSGFTSGYDTYLCFNRESLHDLKFLEKVISSIHGMKMDIIKPEDLQIAQQGQEHIFAEYVKNLVELIDQSGSLIWKYSITRRLRFTSRFTDPIKHAAWAGRAPSEKHDYDSNIKWSVSFNNGSKQFKITTTEESCTCDNCLIYFNIEPKPEAEDFIEYSVSFESPYLNPVFKEDILDPRPKVVIDGAKYLCADGTIPGVRTQNLKIQFRFPPLFGLKQEDFAPFVGSPSPSKYTNRIDYLVESEMKRMTVNKDNFGGNVIIDISIQSPLVQHEYGVAWNPVSEPPKIT
jgi:hypothetical protein